MSYTNGLDKSDEYFNTKLYTGTGSTNAQTVGFSPDLVWLKRRDNVGRHRLFDAVRGATKSVRSDDIEVELTRADSLTSFDSDGFTLGADSISGGINVNISGETMVGWSWRGSDSSAVSNTDGSITSTVSANTTSGFSIVSYTGTGSAATIGHGLSSAPKMIIVKNRDNTEEWKVYHASLGATLFLRLNSTAAQTSSATYQWNGTTPTSSVFSVGEGNSTNTTDYIAYCFAEKKGFSKFGSYVGNGNADGTFVYTGFKPAFVMIKKVSSAEAWWLIDDARDPYNPAGTKYILPNSSDAEVTTNNKPMDLLSNGFKLRDATGYHNDVATYIYMAFAEEPLVGDNPATAR